MNSDLLIRDPVFQLNILLWMAKEQPIAGYRVRPVFFEHGFRIIYIEQPFPLPEEITKAARDSGLRISLTPEPELILGRNQDGNALYFEAKADSFSPNSSTSKQARGHLLAAGPAFSEVLAPLSSCLLCYVVPDDKREQMSSCLSTLSEELTTAGLPPGAFSSHGLRIINQSLEYVWDLAFSAHVGVNSDSIKIIDDLEDETDPNPLILVFSEEDCPNSSLRDLYRRSALDQLRARLLCNLHSLPVHREYIVTADDLLAETSDGVFQYLGRKRQKRLRLLVRENLFRRIRDHWKDKPSGIRLEGNKLSILWQSVAEKEAFLNWLEDRRVKFDTTKPIEKSLPLLDDLPDASDGEN